MYAIDNAFAAATRPAVRAAGLAGYFARSDPNATPPVPATPLDEDWVNSVMVELLTVILAAGLTPSKADSTQLYQALQAIIAGWSGQALTYVGNPNGHVAGHAGSVGAPPTTCFDTAGGDLYVCFATGTATTAVWRRAINTSDLDDRLVSASTAVRPGSYLLDSSAGSFTLTPPAVPTGPGKITFIDGRGLLGVHPVTIAIGPSVSGPGFIHPATNVVVAEDIVLDVSGLTLGIWWDAAASHWRVV